MNWIMTIAAGVALGYFLVQFLTKNARVEKSAEETAEVKAEGGVETEAQEEAPRARLHRSRTNKQIAGVCGGIAEYLHADPTIVRLAAVVLMFGWGSGLLAYIICALVLPEE